MTPRDLSTFKKAVNDFNQGHKNIAYEQLKGLQAANSYDSNLLLWLIYTAPNVVEMKQNFDRMDQIDPENPNLPSARQWLQSQMQPNNG